MTDPIRDALREAGEAVCARWADGDDAECRAAHHADAAAAVAAFLRALPNGHTLTHGDYWRAEIDDDVMHAIAAAVERAAGGSHE